MKLIKPNCEILSQENNLEGIYKQIEIAGRTCYKSQDKITEDSSIKFVQMLIDRGHCYTGESEVLTTNGWIKWKNYVKESVAVVNLDLTFKGFEKPKRVLKHEYSGNFYIYPELGLEVTDGHHMYGMFANNSKERSSAFTPKLFNVGETYKDANKREKTLGERFFRSATNCIFNISEEEINPYYELIGFWVGDGCVDSSKSRLKFHLKKERKIKYLESIIIKLGWNFIKGKSNNYYIETPDKEEINIKFNEMCFNNGFKTIFETTNLIEIYSIIQGLINSDGSVEKTGTTYTSTSRLVIDWLLKNAPLVGYNIIEGTVNKQNIELGHNDAFKVFLLKRNYILNNDSRKPDSIVHIVSGIKTVYCVTVSTGLILVRGTNGRVSVCGNCAMLEHGTVYLIIAKSEVKFNEYRFYQKNKYSKVFEDENHFYITTNFRIINEYKREEDLKYLTFPFKYHEKRVAVKFICDRGISHELVRHRVFSFAQESTRYCNYSKNQFSNELTFIIPCWILENEFFRDNDFSIETNIKDVFTGGDYSDLYSYFKILQEIENSYFKLLDYKWQPQQARAVLPNSLKTEIIMTGFVSDWKHFFGLRCAEAAHPQMRELAIPLQEEFIKLNLI